MTPENFTSEDFIPATCERDIGNGIVFRPRRSWHTGVYAGEKLFKIPGTNDGSGCLKHTREGTTCYPPYTVTHRCYWRQDDPSRSISAFLSYPGAMGAVNEYFWEIYPGRDTGDVERFTGDNAEEEMEDAIKELLK